MTNNATANVLDFTVRPEERKGTTRVGMTGRAEARLLALGILRDPVYLQRLYAAARARTLPPAIELALYHYAYGKPTEHMEVGRPGDFDDFSSMTETELAEKAKQLSAFLDAAIACAPTAPVEDDAE